MEAWRVEAGATKDEAVPTRLTRAIAEAAICRTEVLMIYLLIPLNEKKVEVSDCYSRGEDLGFL